MQGETKKLGFFNVFSLGVGGAIGSGIFVMLGTGIALTGHSIVLAMLVACVYMTIAYLSHPIMSSMFVLPGGDYDIKVLLFNPVMTGASAIFCYMNSIGLAAYGLAMVNYAGMIFPGILPYGKPLAVLIVTLFFAATLRGSKFVANLASIMTVVLLASMALFVGMGVPNVQPGFLSDGQFFLNGGKGFIQAISIMAFACAGITQPPLSVMEVTQKPRRTVPIAIIFITLTVGVVYSLMALVASGVLPVEQVANQNLAVVAETVFPRWLYIVFILGGAVFAIASSLISGIAALRYPCIRVAEDGWVPAFFRKTTKNGFPYVIMGAFYLVSVLPILLDFSLDAIVSLVTIPLMLMNVYLNLALIKVVKKYPDQWRSSVFHMPSPVFNLLCAFSAVCALVVAYNLFMMLASREMVACVVVIVLCLGVSVIRLKTGAVKKEDLLAKQEEIAARAIAATGND